MAKNISISSSKQRQILNQIKKFKENSKKLTDSRKNVFAKLMPFVFDADHLTSEQRKIRNSDGKHTLILNFAEDYYKRYLSKLFPRSPRTGVMEVGVKVYHDNNDIQDKYNDSIQSSYRQNRLTSILLEQATNFLIGGSACLYYPKDPVTGKALIKSLDPTKIYLQFDSDGILRQFLFADKDSENKDIYIYSDLENHINYSNNELTITPNSYDFVPLSWIPSFPKPHSHEGNSEILSLMNIDIDESITASNYFRRIDENTEPHIAIFSDRMKLKKVERGPRKQTKLGSNDDMKYLELSEGSEILDFLSYLDTKLRFKTGLIDTQQTSNKSLSGFSLSFLYSDMLDRIALMRIYWDKAFMELNNAILTYEYGIDTYETTPVYHPSLVADSAARVDEYSKMIADNVISRKDAIDELRGVENSEQKLNEIIKENELFAASQSIDNNI